MVWFGAGLEFLINNLISDLDVGARSSRYRDVCGEFVPSRCSCAQPRRSEHVGLRNKELPGSEEWREWEGGKSSGDTGGTAAGKVRACLL